MGNNGKTAGITLCMIVKNEEANLPRCLDRARTLVDELLVVDTGSTDKTVQLAKAGGARVEHFGWINDFSAARNYASDQCRTDYELVLDADEWFSAKDCPKLKEEFARTMSAGKGLVTYNRSYVPQVSIGMHANTHAYPDDEMGIGYLESLRAFLFPTGTRYHGCVHESPDLGRCGHVWTHIPMHHSGHMNKAREASKGGYYELGLKKLKEIGDGYGIREELGRAAQVCGRYLEARDHWMRAISMNPGSPKAFMGYAAASIGLDRYGEARAAAKRALKLAPESVDAMRLMAWVELFSGNAAATRDLCSTAFKRDPAPGSLLLGIVAMLCLDGDPDGVSTLKQRVGVLHVEETLDGFAGVLHRIGQTRYAENIRRAIRGSK